MHSVAFLFSVFVVSYFSLVSYFYVLFQFLELGL